MAHSKNPSPVLVTPEHQEILKAHNIDWANLPVEQILAIIQALVAIAAHKTSSTSEASDRPSKG